MVDAPSYGQNNTTQSHGYALHGAGKLERLTHIDGDGFNTAVDESWKYDL